MKSKPPFVKLICVGFAIMFFWGAQNVSAASLPAFPGAEGFGAYSVGGRGGMVIKVTNLNDSGPGSFREALAASGPRIIVFDVSGVIYLTSLSGKAWINNGYVTIAGQTSPGGITLAGELDIVAPHVVVTHMRFRPPNKDHAVSMMNHGNPSSVPANYYPSFDAHDIIFDHCSFSWASDENWSVAYGAYNITLQNSIVADPSDSGYHAKDVLINGKDSDRAETVTLYRNLIATANDRMPQWGSGGQPSQDYPPLVDIVNNVIYNWKSRITMTQAGWGYANIVHNYLKPGPNSDNNTGSGPVAHIDEYSCIRIWLSNTVIPPDGIDPLFPPAPSMYVDGNMGCDRTDQGQTQWKVGWSPAGAKNFNQAYATRNHLSTAYSATTAYQASTRYDTPTVPIMTASSAMADEIIATAGATKVSDPTWRSSGFGRDGEDQKIINDYNNGTGTIPTSLTYPDSYSSLGYNTSVIPQTDTDNDGMPDSWELLSFGNLTRNGKGDFDSDGYTDIEKYLFIVGGYTSGTIPPSTPPTPIPDITPPTISISSPASNFTISNTVSIVATASDNVGVTGVQFKLDGANLGTEDISSPYSYIWDSKTVANGSHTIMGTAKDVVGNITTSTTVTVNVNNEVTPLSPKISSFTASPTSITAGQTTTLSWLTSEAISISIDQGIGTVTASGATVVTPPGTTTYIITTTNSSGTTLRSVTVTVTPIPIPTSNLTPTVKPTSAYTPPYTPTSTYTPYITQTIPLKIKQWVDTNGTCPKTVFNDNEIGDCMRYCLNKNLFNWITTEPATTTTTNTPVYQPNTTPTGITLTKTLYIGLRNTEVTTLQNYLISHNYLSAGNNTGYYGILTRAAVRKYQCNKSIVCSGTESSTGYGVVGRITRAMLER